MGFINIIAKACVSSKLNRTDKDHVTRFQERRLRRLLHHAASHSEFYHKLYKGIDIERCRLRDLPVVTKSTMMENFDRFVADKRLKLREIQDWRRDETNTWKRYLGEFIPVYTSGTSAETALMVYNSKALQLAQAGLLARSFPADKNGPFYYYLKILWRLLLGKKLRAAAIVVPRGNIYPVFNFATRLPSLFAEVKILPLVDPIQKIVGQLNEFQPHCLITLPFFIASLAEEQLAGRLDIKFDHPLSFLAGAGEPLTEHTQKLALMAWNKKIRNVYGSTECYTMAASGPNCERLHVMSDLCILEVVDQEYNAVPKGQYGDKLLLTNLFNLVQPIIRYEIGDVTGYADHSCECGNPFPTLLPVRGRTADFVYFEKSPGTYEKFHPFIMMIHLFYVNDLRQYQIVQTRRNELTLYYVQRKGVVDIEQQLTRALTDALAHADLVGHVTLKFEKVESIPRDERSGKFQMMKSLGAPPDCYTQLDSRTC
jgi:phenylacetate-coenzyme A ligase PaaK-like adenylate-forming protein